MLQIKEKLGDISTAINVLNEAYKKINHGNNNRVASQICCQMAEYEASLHNFESAIRNYKLALSHNEENSNENSTIQIALSKLYLQVSLVELSREREREEVMDYFYWMSSKRLVLRR